MTNSSTSFDVVITGGGPAGSSAAIKLRLEGARVLLLEAKKFPRAKLCGEFISPECIPHFERLGVVDEMFAAGGAPINKTVFYGRNGLDVHVPSEWFNPTATALGLSRQEMDHKLLERAKQVGVTVWEDAHATGLIRTGKRVAGVIAKAQGQLHECLAPLTIDATGRNRTLARELDGRQHLRPKPKLVAFKVHLENTRIADGACEIYFYKRGYGGLSAVENGLSNLCFIVAARDVRRYGSDPDVVRREVVMKNKRAAYTLRDAHARTEWLSVSLPRFGRFVVAPSDGLLTVGDAASFIDPFTGGGMLMALESGTLVADTISRHLPRLSENTHAIAAEYQIAYSRAFGSRLRTAGLMRRAAFVPGFAELAIQLCGLSSRLRRRLARATHQSPAPAINTFPSNNSYK